MPVAGKIYTKKIVLPNYPEEAFVVVVTNPRGDIWAAANSMEDKRAATYEILSKIITEWNFTDEQGQVLQVTPENIKLALSIVDEGLILQALNIPSVGLSDAKKNS